MNYIGNQMRLQVSWGVLGYPWVSWGVLGYPGVSWGNQTDPIQDGRWQEAEINKTTSEFLLLNL